MSAPVPVFLRLPALSLLAVTAAFRALKQVLSLAWRTPTRHIRARTKVRTRARTRHSYVQGHMYVYTCDVYVIDVPTYVYQNNVYYYVHTCTSQTDRKTDRKTDRRKDGRMERWTDGKKERRTERETGRQTCIRACLTYSDNGSPARSEVLRFANRMFLAPGGTWILIAAIAGCSCCFWMWLQLRLQRACFIRGVASEHVRLYAWLLPGVRQIPLN